MKKRVLATMLSMVLATGLVACGSGAANHQAEKETTPETQEQTAETTVLERETTESETTESETTESEAAESETGTTEEAEANTDEESGKVLVVYYSATGHTKAVAEVIADETGADLFEVVPAELYTDEDLDWTESDSRVSIEHDNPDARAVELVADTVENWDEYDTVYIGAPIWWGIAAWPVDTFVKANDFTGKTVIPFMTAASSGLGESGELLAEMAGAGDWLEGECFRSNVAEDDVREWIGTLGL